MGPNQAVDSETSVSYFKQRREVYRFTHQLQAWLGLGVLSQVFPSCATISSGSSIATLFSLEATKITRLVLIGLS